MSASTRLGSGPRTPNGERRPGSLRRSPFATKPELAGDMIEAALDAGVGADFATGDEAYGINPVLRAQLRARSLAYVLAIACSMPVRLGSGKATAAEALQAAGESRWQIRSPTT
jgi:SRSO17 transposase